MKASFSSLMSATALAMSLTALGVSIWNWNHAPTKSNNEPLKAQLPVASFDKPCLKISPDGVNSFQSSEIEKSDFCTSEGEPIEFVITSDTGSWRFSTPWLDKGQVIRHRLAFARENAYASKTSFSVMSTERSYYFVITADRI